MVLLCSCCYPPKEEMAFITGEAQKQIIYTTKAQELNYAIWGDPDNPNSCLYACCCWPYIMASDCSDKGYCPVRCLGPDMTVSAYTTNDLILIAPDSMYVFASPATYPPPDTLSYHPYQGLDES